MARHLAPPAVRCSPARVVASPTLSALFACTRPSWSILQCTDCAQQYMRLRSLPIRRCYKFPHHWPAYEHVLQRFPALALATEALPPCCSLLRVIYKCDQRHNCYGCSTAARLILYLRDKADRSRASRLPEKLMRKKHEHIVLAQKKGAKKGFWGYGGTCACLLCRFRGGGGFRE